MKILCAKDCQGLNTTKIAKVSMSPIAPITTGSDNTRCIIFVLAKTYASIIKMAVDEKLNLNFEL